MKRILILLFAILIGSCKNNRIDRPEKPKNLLSQDQMVEVIYDMTLMSAAKGLNRRIIENNGVDPEAFVFEKHNIDSVQFAESNRYYSYDIKVYESIYQRVKTKLEAQKKVFNSELKKRATKADSISNANTIRRDSLIRVKTLEANPDYE